MGFDYSAFLSEETARRETDPELLFQTLEIRDPKVERLWGEQVDALRGWKSRTSDSSDTLIQLNTGAGKTLVGLLIAQSIINKSSGHVLYLCSTNQLVSQTAEKAALYGLDCTTYIEGDFSDDAFESGRAACATSYASIFNGFTSRRGRFKDYPLSAIVFDDAHTAEAIIRSSYTLTIRRPANTALYDRITDMYRVAFDRIDKTTTFNAVVAGKLSETFLAPQYVTADLRTELTHELEAFVESNDDAKYPWQHIADTVDRCAVLIGPGAIEISPPFVPIANHFAFGKKIERIYLSATLDSSDSFIRAFGDRKISLVSANTNTGDGERLIVLPSLFKEKGKEDYIDAQALAASRKTLISVPTYKRAEVWKPYGVILDSATVDVDAKLTEFRDANDARKIVLIARYDGLDLPEEQCRMMVIDESPSGASSLEHFLYERLGLTKRLQTTIASRVVQSFGRICRGIKDHGCFILTGTSLMQWLKRPANQARLPKFLRRQISQSLKLSGTVANLDSGSRLICDFFNRAPEGQPGDQTWSKIYQSMMKDWQKDADPTPVPPVLVKASKAEVRFASLIMDGAYSAAASVFGEVVDEVFAESSGYGAWISYWLAFAYERAGDPEMATHYYARAHGATKGILTRPPSHTPTAEQFSPQIQNLASEFNLHQETGKISKVFANVRRQLAPLGDPSATPNQQAAAVAALGQYLGLLPYRPDPGESGPDVHWFLPQSVSFGMELKTHKDRGPCYSKDELGQVDDHLRWAREHYPDAARHECVFVGPDLPACKGTTPGDQFRSIALEDFAAIGETLISVLEPLCAKHSPLEFMPAAYDALKNVGLLYDDLLEGLKRRQIAAIATNG